MGGTDGSRETAWQLPWLLGVWLGGSPNSSGVGAGDGEPEIGNGKGDAEPGYRGKMLRPSTEAGDADPSGPGSKQPQYGVGCGAEGRCMYPSCFMAVRSSCNA